MVPPTEWSEEDVRFLKRNYWHMTYAEIADELGMSSSVVHRKAKDGLKLPKKTEWNRVEHNHGVPMVRILNHLHHDAKMSVNKMSNALNVSRITLDRWFEDTGVYKRGRSEAESLKWEQMSEAEREKQVRAAHETVRELIEDGGHVLQKWREENPDLAKKHAKRVAALGATGRKRNGMMGVTGQDHPNWRGGKSIYDAVKRQLHGPSWNVVRTTYRAEADHTCEMCGTTIEEAPRSIDVHHIIPIMSGGTNEGWNLMALCESCHTKAEWYTRDIIEPVLVE